MQGGVVDRNLCKGPFRYATVIRKLESLLAVVQLGAEITEQTIDLLMRIPYADVSRAIGHVDRAARFHEPQRLSHRA